MLASQYIDRAFLLALTQDMSPNVTGMIVSMELSLLILPLSSDILMYCDRIVPVVDISPGVEQTEL